MLHYLLITSTMISNEKKIYTYNIYRTLPSSQAETFLFYVQPSIYFITFARMTHTIYVQCFFFAFSFFGLHRSHCLHSFNVYHPIAHFYFLLLNFCHHLMYVNIFASYFLPLHACTFHAILKHIII